MKMFEPKYSDGSLEILPFIRAAIFLVVCPPPRYWSHFHIMSADPVGGGLGDHELQAGEALERAGEQEVPHRPGGPPDDLGQVDADVLAHLLARRLAGVGVDREPGGLAGGPDRVVGGVVVGQSVPPHGRDHHAPDAGLAGQPLDLLDAPLDVVGDGDQGDAASALRAVAAHLDEEAVVGPGAGIGQLRVVDHPGPQAGAERRRGHAGDGVGVGEHDLGRRRRRRPSPCPAARGRRRPGDPRRSRSPSP